MADVHIIVSNFMRSISDAARQVKVHQKTIKYLTMECQAVLHRLESGELGPKGDPRLNELADVFGGCRSELTAFTGIGFLFRGFKNGDILKTCEKYSEKLQEWQVEPLRISDAEADAEERENELYMEKAFKIRAQPQEVLDLDVTKLERGEEVGKFPFGTIYLGTYKEKSVYIRELDKRITGVHLELVWSSIRRSKRFFDTQNIIPILGFCGERMIVTETTTKGPLDKFSITTPLQKVVIAREIANTVLAMHDTAADGKRMEGRIMQSLDANEERVLHGDLRAANILIDKSEYGDDKLTAKLTGFEMCKQSKIGTGDYPHIDESYRKWWSPQRKDNGGSTVESEVYAFGVLMYEISTGKEPEDGDPERMEDTQIHPKYNALMKECLKTRVGSRPSMKNIVLELVSIETILIAGGGELR